MDYVITAAALIALVVIIGGILLLPVGERVAAPSHRPLADLARLPGDRRAPYTLEGEVLVHSDVLIDRDVASVCAELDRRIERLERAA